MEFLNIGWPELLLILVVAFIVLGPNRLTQFGHDLGKWLHKLNNNQTFREVVRTTDEIRNYPQKIINEARLDRSMIIDENGQIHTPKDSGQAENPSKPSADSQQDRP